MHQNLMGPTEVAEVDYARLEIHRQGHWLWQVHENQSYLGRMILRLLRLETGSLAQCTAGEWGSLHENIREYEEVIAHLFSPDRLNYCQMGNEYPQLHVQAVPRYRSNRAWGSQVFHDINWGHNWAPTPESPLTTDETYKFAAWFREQMLRRVQTR